MKEEGCNLGRRRSGGGAVFQDLGNTCVSFLTPLHKDSPIDSSNIKAINN